VENSPQNIPGYTDIFTVYYDDTVHSVMLQLRAHNRNSKAEIKYGEYFERKKQELRDVQARMVVH